ncbi:MAG: permease [Lentisphaeria bacterium]|nr:permease [Lentisphaeria bacterium]
MENYLHELWMLTIEIAPWLLFGFLIAGTLHVFFTPAWIQHKLGGSGFAPIVKSVLFGIPLPLCSCGVIPTGLGLYKDGATKSATTSFLIATPQTGVDSIGVSGAVLGWPFAIYKVLAAIVTGILGGVLIHKLDEDQHPYQTNNIDKSLPLSKKVRLIFEFAIDDLFASIWKAFVIGMLLAAAVAAWIPVGAISSHVPFWLQHFLVLFISIPLYVCAVSSVPLAAALVMAGLSPGAAMIFLMAGPATNIATMAALWKGIGKKATLIYLFAIISGSIVSGILFDVLPMFKELDEYLSHDHIHENQSLIQILAAAILLLLLFRFVVRDLKCRFLSNPPLPKGKHSQFQIEGLSCGNCIKKITSYVDSKEGIHHFECDLKVGIADIYHDEGINLESIYAGIEELGFRVLPYKNIKSCCS